jgi:hypothetical protein
MSVLSKTLLPATCGDTPKSTTLRDLAAGPSLLESRDGPMTDPSPRGRAHANRSHKRANKKASTTPATSGLISEDLSPSQALTRSLLNRLPLHLNGSVSCEVIWKQWDAPWGESLWKPRARARSIFVIDIGLWPTIQAAARMRSGHQVNLQDQVISLGVWPTARVGNNGGYGNPDRLMNPKNCRIEDTVPGVLKFATAPPETSIAVGLWPTATSRDHFPPHSEEYIASKRAQGHGMSNLNDTVYHLGVWSTLRASDGEKGGPNQSFGAGGSPLPSQISTVANTSNVPTENGAGSLHPAFCGWELGYPPEYLNCAPSETRLITGRRSRS